MQQIISRLLRQFFPLAVTRNELEVLQASFLMTHEIESSYHFSFMAYLQYSVEDDFAQMVGVRWTHWLFIICYILLSTVIGEMKEISFKQFSATDLPN